MPEGQSLRDARAAYFAANGFGADGGYDASWVTFRLGPIPVAFPNVEARVRAVRIHDLHHVVTGYATDVVGEAEIGAWEIAGSCRGFVAAWVLNLWAMALGLVTGPRATRDAFVRGRHSRNLYGVAIDDALLAEPVAAVQAHLGLDATAPRPTLADHLAFAGWCVAAMAFAFGTLALPVLVLAALLRA